jgi:TonB-dependent receptor
MCPKLKLLFFITLFFSLKLTAQNAVLTGKISDETTNQPLAGASITISSTKKTVTSQSDGNYVFQNIAPGKYSLLVSYVGYDSKNIGDVEVLKGDITTLNITLVPAKNSNLTAVVVTATSAKKENFNALLVTRRNASVVSDGISADMIRKSPDKNTGDVIKRISGTSVQDGKYVVVRGMNDRYNEAMLNGIILPSSESDRKTFAFDIFPSEVVDNITIYKSAQPDLPGSFAGGLVQLNTKDVPDKKFISLKTSIGFNSITVDKDFLTYPGSKTDWLGFDNTVRKLPGVVANIPSQDFNNIRFDDPARKQTIDRSFANNWAVYPRASAPVNNAFQVSGGFNALLSKKSMYPKLGGIFGVTYNSSFTFAQQKRSYVLQPTQGDFPEFRFSDSDYTQNVLTSGLANLALRLNANNKIFFNNILSVNSNDQLIKRGGRNDAYGQPDIQAYSYRFVSNRIFNTQLGGEHLLPKSKIKINWFGYYTDLKRDEPDNRFMNYFRYDSTSPYIAELAVGGTLATVSSGLRFFNNIKDQSKGANLDLLFPFDMIGQKQSFKTGSSYYYNTRDINLRYFNTNLTEFVSDPSLQLKPIDQIFDTANFNPQDGLFFAEPSFAFLNFSGSVKTIAAYAMLDNRFTKNLRLVWGMRLEKYKNILNGFDQAFKPTLLTEIKKDDWLPSANLIYSILPKANLRASYGRTVVRPVYRELSPNIFYDFVLNAIFNGKPSLVPTYIDNYELRWEHFFGNAQYYSVSVFYKKMKDAIEPVASIGTGSLTIDYANISKTNNRGIELELRKDFSFISKGLSNLVFYANTAFIQSKVDTVGLFESKKSTRPLFGQSPYIVNASLQYTEPKTNIGLSVLFNKAGARIWLLDQYYSRIIFEEPRPILDLKISKGLFNNKGSIEFSWADVLHKNSIFFNDVDGNGKYNKGTDLVAIERKYGYTMSLAVSYRF